MMDLFQPMTIGLVLLGLIVALELALFQWMKAQRRNRLSQELKQLQILRGLLGDFQRHRGLSTAALSGNSAMKADRDQTRQKLGALCDRAKKLLPDLPPRWKRLLDEWRMVCDASDHDSENNLKNHNQLIRKTIFLLEDVASHLDLRVTDAERQELNYIWHEIIQVSEWTGQARALGTGIAAAQNSTAEQRIRLRFLHQKISQQSSDAFRALESQQSAHAEKAKCQQSVENFLKLLESELLNREIPQIDAQHYFAQATDAINDLLAMVDSTLNKLHRQQLGSSV